MPAAAAGVSGHDPYVALGLRANPFALGEGSAVPLALWVERGHSRPPAPGQRRLVQLLGPKGYGKSAHLRHWQGQQPGPYHYVAPQRGRWRLPPRAPIAYWDEADRLPRPVLGLALWRAARGRATIAVGSHRDLAPLALRLGLAVQTIPLEPPRAAELCAWAARAIAAAALPGATPLLCLDEAQAALIAAASDEGWRGAADALHAWAARQAAAQQHAG